MFSGEVIISENGKLLLQPADRLSSFSLKR
jgi:hypothetical protein